ncbi:uncharacterized protein EV422DRAFT_495262 [Fimicolochytrium jonesii]|uniref:uncharacterized protein n=1 Tax=Fimicolochytrium jonesii TaxID=1396493 RepID=UPI0022FEB5CE|nr:uncharacterized protein EV422DRAFT_495262 [Fimicolochytrium jonesii]KAI8821991.1 hypothetical protein EV422DRAFT_495262 [Fimicolochytrium jonesii]
MRTVYLGNLPSLTTYEDVINLVRGGALEQVKILEEKNCAFITFVESSAAHAFHLECQNKRPHLQTSELKVGWGKHTPIPPAILAAVQGGASRNVFLGNIDESVTDTVLHQEFGKFGPIDQVKILPDKRIAFVHMASIVAAMKAVQNLPNEPRWATRRVNYGKDRCAYQPKGPGSTRPSPPTTPGGLVYAGATSFGHGMGVGYGMGYNDPFSGLSGGATNRTVYLGSIHPDVTTKDLCDVIRGGILQNIKYMPDKNIAFVTFIDPSAAVNFYNRGNYEGLVLKGKRLKVGWGKPSALPPGVATAVQSGASRNVYIGAIDESISEDRLRKDFSEFGDIELINIIADKNIGFVNFVDLTSAVKAVEALKSDDSKGYGQYRINFGKDRCGNPPRPPRESAAQRAAAVAAAAAAGDNVPMNGPMGVDAFGAGGMVQHVDSMSSMDESEHLAGLLGNNTNYL